MREGLGRLSGKQMQGLLAADAAKELLQRRSEGLGLLRHSLKQRETAAKLECIDWPQYCLGTLALVRADGGKALMKPLSQKSMLEIGCSFLRPGDAVELCVGAQAKPSELRQNVPDPMRLLLALLEFVQRSCVAAGLGLDESLKVVGLLH